MFLSGLDLNVEAQNWRFLRISAEGSHASRQTRFLASHDVFAADHLSSMCSCPSGRTQGQGFFLSGSIFRHGVCAIDLSRTAVRYRSQFARPSPSFVPHGLSLCDDFPQYAGQCKCHTSLASLCGLGATSDCDGASDVCQRTVWRGYRCDGIYAVDATTIDLCLSVYPWAPFRSAKAAIKLHTLLDLRGSIPSFIHITDGKTHEVDILDDQVIEPGAYYLMDRGYLDFARLHRLYTMNAFFVTRAKSNTKFKRRYSHPVDRTTSNVICDQTGVLPLFYASKDYPTTLRRVVVKDNTGKRIIF